MYINDIVDPIHFGYWGGLLTKIIWFIIGCGITSLVGTGIWIFLKRKALKQKKNDTKVMGNWLYINWAIVAIIIFITYYASIDTYQITPYGLVIISLGFITTLCLTYYFFTYRIKKSVQKELNIIP